MKSFLVFLPLHEFLYPSRVAIFNRVELGSCIGRLNNHVFDINLNFLVFYENSLLQKSQLVLFESFFVFLSCISILRFHFADCLEIFHSEVVVS